jgi:hypothetical protein
MRLSAAPQKSFRLAVTPPHLTSGTLCAGSMKVIPRGRPSRTIAIHYRTSHARMRKANEPFLWDLLVCFAFCV